MNFLLTVIIFLGSCFVLSYVSSKVIESLAGIARYLRWREFIIAFFIIAFAASLPNLFVDLNAAFQGHPELGFGDIIGGNLADLTIVMAVAVFFSRRGLSAESNMVQTSGIFTMLIAILPLLVVWDGNLSRADGLILIGAFFVYCAWLFSKKENFQKIYHSKNKNPISDFKSFLKNMAKVVLLVGLLAVASQAVISSAHFFSAQLGVSIGLVGLLIVGLGNCFPEMYFSIIAARKEANWLVLGDIMGAVIISATLVLGLIGLLFPFQINDPAPYTVARIFLIVAALVSLFFIRTGHKITKKEGMLLGGLYVAFLIVEIFIQ